MGSMSTRRAHDVQATFCASLVDQWIRRGLQHAVIAPGSRSTPLALAMIARPELCVEIFHDERSAGFAALGVGLASGQPAAVLCTSGTASTHFHAAVVEADLSGIPMLVLTADRPPELHGIGAPQTINQTRLFGDSAVFVDPGVASIEAFDVWRQWADSWYAIDGPVHINLPFREPLVGEPFELPTERCEPPNESSGTVTAQTSSSQSVLAMLAAHTDLGRGLIVAGRGIDNPLAVADLASQLGWPILADPRSGCRGLPLAISTADAIIRSDIFAAAHRPGIVLHCGEPPASKLLGQWLSGSGALHVQVLQRDRVIDPLQMMSARVVGSVGRWCEVIGRTVTDQRGDESATPDAPLGWTSEWLEADRIAHQVFDRYLANGTLSEPSTARILSGRPGPLVVSSSMPIRDIEWFGQSSGSAQVISNRGANGIDGVVATAIGVALSRRLPTTVLIGDVALCHDASSLTALGTRAIDLKIVVTDNDGGGIFSFLPQAEQLQTSDFERIFGTPHGTDLVMLAQAHGLVGETVDTPDQLAQALDRPGSALIRVQSNREANVSVHQAIHAAVVGELDRQLDSKNQAGAT